MALELGEPRIIERGPYCVVGVYAIFEGDAEGPAWDEAFENLEREEDQITNRVGDTLLGFLYRPHKDDPSVGEDVRSCFLGMEVTDLDHVPEGMAATRFTGGQYVIVECRGETQDEATMGVGDAIDMLDDWIGEHGYSEGDACFACSHEDAATPPFTEYVYIKLEPQD